MDRFSALSGLEPALSGQVDVAGGESAFVDEAIDGTFRDGDGIRQRSDSVIDGLPLKNQGRD